VRRFFMVMVVALAACGSPDTENSAGRCEPPSGPERPVDSDGMGNFRGCQSSRAVAVGTVKTVGGRPLEHATLDVQGKGENPPEVQPMSILTNERGHFLVTLEPGEYDVTARHRGYAPSVKTAIVEEKERVALRFRLSRPN
jgi:hypothetical protein